MLLRLLSARPQACADLRVDARYVCKMELLLLQTLQWRVTNATSVSFVCYLLRRLHLPSAERRRSIREHALDVVRRIIEGAWPSAARLALRHAVADLALLFQSRADPLYLRHRPSVLAAAALKFAVRQGEWEAVGEEGVERHWRVLEDLVGKEVRSRGLRLGTHSRPPRSTLLLSFCEAL